MPPDMPPGEAWVWIGPVPEKLGPSAEAALSRLPSEEQERFARYIPDRARLEFLTGRVLTRCILARHLHLKDWREVVLDKTPHGKLTCAQAAAAGFEFNLSHTRGCAAFAICKDHPIGVDIEVIDSSRADLGIAERYFSPSEVSHLRTLDRRHFIKAFFQYWTLKEAYIKARGLGLQIPLNEFSFSLGRRLTEDSTIHFSPEIDDDPARWQFRTLGVGGSDLSVAIYRGEAPNLSIRRIWLVEQI